MLQLFDTQASSLRRKTQLSYVKISSPVVSIASASLFLPSLQEEEYLSCRLCVNSTHALQIESREYVGTDRNDSYQQRREV